MQDNDFSDDRTLIITTKSRPSAVSRADWVHSLVMQQGHEPGQRQTVNAVPIRLGRRAPCEWLLADTEVSGQHCQVQAETGVDALTVTDLGSTNGTFVDGQRVVGTAKDAAGADLPQFVKAEPGHKQSSGLFVPGEGPGHWPGAACKASSTRSSSAAFWPTASCVCTAATAATTS